MADGDALVAVFNSHGSVEEAVRRLHLTGYDVKRLSIVLQNDTLVERVAGFYNAQERIRRWGKTGAVIGGLSALGASVYSSILPKDSVLKFEPQVEARNSKFLLMARSTAAEAAAVRRSLWSGGPVEVEVR